MLGLAGVCKSHPWVLGLRICKFFFLRNACTCSVLPIRRVVRLRPPDSYLVVGRSVCRGQDPPPPVYPPVRVALNFSLVSGTGGIFWVRKPRDLVPSGGVPEGRSGYKAERFHLSWDMWGAVRLPAFASLERFRLRLLQEGISF